MPETKISQKFYVLPQAEQDVLIVPVYEWHRIMSRITHCNDTTHRLESFGWFSLGAAISLGIFAWQFPANATFSEVIDKVEKLNLRAYATEWGAIAFAFLFLLIGLISLYHARDKAKMHASMSDLIIEDMGALESRHLPRLHQESTSATLPA